MSTAADRRSRLRHELAALEARRDRLDAQGIIVDSLDREIEAKRKALRSLEDAAEFLGRVMKGE